MYKHNKGKVIKTLSFLDCFALSFLVCFTTQIIANEQVYVNHKNSKFLFIVIIKKMMTHAILFIGNHSAEVDVLHTFENIALYKRVSLL